MLGAVSSPHRTYPPVLDPAANPSEADQLRRIRVAAYLYQLAEAVRRGEIESFKAEWARDQADINVDLVPVLGVNSGQ